MTKKLNDIDIDDIKSEYEPVYDIFTNERDITYRIKRIIHNDLTETERRIILLYADQMSQRKVANALGVSTSLANIKINEIRMKIIDRLNEYTD